MTNGKGGNSKGKPNLSAGHPLPQVVYSVDEKTRVPRAPCRTLQNPDIMFPENGSNRSLGMARGVCLRCPIDIKTACLKWAIVARPDFGVWAGLSSNQIQKMARAHNVRVRFYSRKLK